MYFAHAMKHAIVRRRLIAVLVAGESQGRIDRERNGSGEALQDEEHYGAVPGIQRRSACLRHSGLSGIVFAKY
jgi:hypothetical protein